MQTEQVRTPWGPLHILANDTGVSRALRDFGEYGAEEVAAYRRLLEPGDAFVDVGANIGAVSRGVATADSRPRVIGFEPQPDLYRVASANLVGCGDATVYPLAASDHAGLLEVNEIDLRRPGNYGRGEIAGRRLSPRRVPVPAVRLDEFLKPRAPEPRLIKVDVEGMEAAVLRGLAGLRHGRLVVSVEADRPDNLPAILAELAGFSVFAAFFRMIRASHPKFDRSIKECRIRHVQLLAFAGPAPDWVKAPAYPPVPDAAEFERLWAERLDPVDPGPA